MKTLQLLIVEDNEDDAELLLREFRRARFAPNWSRVETERDFLGALQERPDIIVSDYSMPQFSGLRALQLARASGLDIPFILVSGTIGEDVAVEAMREGAADYLLKDRLTRLPAAVNRALGEKQLRLDRNQAEKGLLEKVKLLARADLERKRLIESLEGALAEKTVLLQEVHHRVKNNMAVIIGLLGMQAATLGDQQARMALEESQQRISSMALIHEYLYNSDHLDCVKFGRYIEELANQVLVSYSINPNPVTIEIEAEEIDLPVSIAIPCGLILNELISNALKYAFPRGRSGKIMIRFGRLKTGALSLSCQDNGVGIPEGLDWKNAGSMGLQIVRILTKQIHGELELVRTGVWTGFELRLSGDQLK